MQTGVRGADVGAVIPCSAAPDARVVVVVVPAETISVVQAVDVASVRRVVDKVHTLVVGALAVVAVLAMVLFAALVEVSIVVVVVVVRTVVVPAVVVLSVERDAAVVVETFERGQWDGNFGADVSIKRKAAEQHKTSNFVALEHVTVYRDGDIAT